MKVAILVFPGVEELDFVGFLEVLAVANRVEGRKHFQIQLVGTEAGPIECSGGLKVVPDAQLGALKEHDLLFVPGGGAAGGTGVAALLDDERVAGALRRTDEEGKMVWSVCTGALLLARAGLLEGRRATTHHQFLGALSKSGARVERARVVVDGRIATGGGVSSSIDVGLELIRRELGAAAAGQVRKRMEYIPGVRPPKKRAARSQGN